MIDSLQIIEFDALLTPILALGETEIIGTVLFLGFVIVLCLWAFARESGASYDVVLKNSVPYCPMCNRQVTYRRDHCRSCGYTIKKYGSDAAVQEEWRREIDEEVDQEVAEIMANAPVPMWKRVLDDPTVITEVLDAIHKHLDTHLFGTKSVTCNYHTNLVTLSRNVPDYSAEISPFVDGIRHGFMVRLPDFQFKTTITTNAEDVVPYDALTENLCDVDRLIIDSQQITASALTGIFLSSELNYYEPPTTLEVERLTWDEPTQVHRDEPDQATDKTGRQGRLDECNIFEVALDGMCCVIFADQKAVAAEIVQLQTIMEKVKSPWARDEVKQRVMNFRRRARDLGFEQTVDDVRERFGFVTLPKQQTVIRRCLESVAGADGQLDAREQSMMDRLLEAFPN